MSKPKISFGGKHTWERLYKAQNGLCFHCGKPMAPYVWTSRKRKDGYTKEHMFPRRFIRGFLFSGLWNTALAHQICNNMKGDKLPSDEDLIRFRELLIKAWGQEQADIFDQKVKIIKQTLIFQKEKIHGTLPQ